MRHEQAGQAMIRRSQNYDDGYGQLCCHIHQLNNNREIRVHNQDCFPILKPLSQGHTHPYNHQRLNA
ncbi:hypothetical protein ES705_50557 [subsurface metagenome]